MRIAATCSVVFVVAVTGCSQGEVPTPSPPGLAPGMLFGAFGGRNPIVGAGVVGALGAVGGGVYGFSTGVASQWRRELGR